MTYVYMFNPFCLSCPSLKLPSCFPSSLFVFITFLIFFYPLPQLGLNGIIYFIIIAFKLKKFINVCKNKTDYEKMWLLWEHTLQFNLLYHLKNL